MAMAGTLMMGALEAVPPPHKRLPALAGGGVSNADDDAPMSPSSARNSKNQQRGGGAAAAGAVAATTVEAMGMEDFEDVDALLASEMEGPKMGDDLSRKLAKYEEEMRLLEDDV